MSVVGYRARNHPQQVAERGARPDVDDRATPPEVFGPLHERFSFTVDAAASPHNTKCERFWTAEDDGLAQPWGPKWINTEGLACRCLCHSSDARHAELGETDAPSEVSPLSVTDCVATAWSATGSDSGNDRPGEGRIPGSEPPSLRKSDGISSPPRDVNGSGIPATLTTTGVVSAETHCPSSGLQFSGPTAAPLGMTSAPTVALPDRSSKITSSPCLPKTAPAPSRGTCCLPAESATGARAVDASRTGSPTSAESPQSTNICGACTNCTLRPERVWVNPPYSHPNLGAWTAKAWREWLGGEPPGLVVMLLPANRTEQQFWQELVEPYRDMPGSPLRCEFLPGRMRFLVRGQTFVGPDERPPFGCCLLIWEEREDSPSAPRIVPGAVAQIHVPRPADQLAFDDLEAS